MEVNPKRRPTTFSNCLDDRQGEYFFSGFSGTRGRGKHAFCPVCDVVSTINAVSRDHANVLICIPSWHVVRDGDETTVAEPAPKPVREAL